MGSSDQNILLYAFIAFITLVAAGFLLSTDFAKWVKKKNYQYEVTFALYMLTPTEKFVFNSVLFLFTSMTCIAAFLYLPAHVKIISERTYYYWAGDSTFWQTASTYCTRGVGYGWESYAVVTMVCFGDMREQCVFG